MVGHFFGVAVECYMKYLCESAIGRQSYICPILSFATHEFVVEPLVNTAIGYVVNEIFYQSNLHVPEMNERFAYQFVSSFSGNIICNKVTNTFGMSQDNIFQIIGCSAVGSLSSELAGRIYDGFHTRNETHESFIKDDLIYYES